MSITANNYWPLGSTIQKKANLSTTGYNHFGLISVNPVNGCMVIFYRKGTHHIGTTQTDPGEIYIRRSYDGGATMSAEISIISESGIDTRNAGGGYDSNGTLFIFYTRETYHYINPNNKNY